MSFPSVSAELKVMPSFKSAIDTGSSQIAKDLLASVKRNFPEHRRTAGTVLHDLEKFTESTNDDRESNIAKNKLMVSESQLAIDAAYDQKSANRKAREQIAERKAKNKHEFDQKQAEEDEKLSETLEVGVLCLFIGVLCLFIRGLIHSSHVMLFRMTPRRKQLSWRRKNSSR